MLKSLSGYSGVSNSPHDVKVNEHAASPIPKSFFNLFIVTLPICIFRFPSEMFKHKKVWEAHCFILLSGSRIAIGMNKTTDTHTFVSPIKWMYKSVWVLLNYPHSNYTNLRDLIIEGNSNNTFRKYIVLPVLTAQHFDTGKSRSKDKFFILNGATIRLYFFHSSFYI